MLASMVGFRYVTLTDSEVVGGLQVFDFWMGTLFIARNNKTNGNLEEGTVDFNST